MFDAIVLYSGENNPFDSCDSAQMKHMHVNEHFRIIPKLTKNEAFVFFMSPANETNEEWANGMEVAYVTVLDCDSVSFVPHFHAIHMCFFVCIWRFGALSPGLQDPNEMEWDVDM